MGRAVKTALYALLPFLLLTPACASKGGDAKAPAAEAATTFQYAPRIGSKFRHIMTRAEESSIVGTPLRQLEEWTITWNVELTTENEATLMRAELAGLALSVNGATVLNGDEVAAKKAFIEILLDSQGRVIDVRRTDTLTDAIVSVSNPESAPIVRAIFEPNGLRYHFAGLVAERVVDLQGKPATVGSSWQVESAPDAPGAATRTLRVMASEPCGAFSCVKVDRETRVAPEIVWEAARQRVADYVKSQGGDPEKIQLAKANIELKDEMLVEPATLQFHGASFVQAATLTVESPNGQLTVTSSLKRSSSYEF